MVVLSPAGIGVKTNGRSAWLDAPAAAAYRRMLAAGMPTGGITDAGRTHPEQVAIFTSRYEPRATGAGPFGDVRRWGGVRYVRVRGASAAVPGTSNHETGRALDLAGQARDWVRAHGAPFGWIKDRVRDEPWHMEYLPDKDTSAKTAPPASTQEDNLMANADDILAAIYDLRDTYLRVPDQPYGYPAALNNKLDTMPRALLATQITGVDGEPGTLGERIAWIDKRLRDLTAQNEGLLDTIRALAVGHGTDPETIAAAAQAGTRRALESARFTVHDSDT